MSEDNKDLGDMAEDAMDSAKDAAKNAGDKAGEVFDDAKEATKEFAEDAKDAAKKAGDKAGEVFEDAKEATKEFAEDAKEATKEFAEDAKETANEFVEGVKDLGGDNKKILAGILAIVLGGLGVHKFILGYQKEGFIMLGITLISIPLTCVIIGMFTMYIAPLIGLVEGIIYLTKSDEEFVNTYQIGKKPWF